MSNFNDFYFWHALVNKNQNESLVRVSVPGIENTIVRIFWRLYHLKVDHVIIVFMFVWGFHSTLPVFDLCRDSHAHAEIRRRETIRFSLTKQLSYYGKLYIVHIFMSFHTTPSYFLCLNDFLVSFVWQICEKMPGLHSINLILSD